MSAAMPRLIRILDHDAATAVALGLCLVAMWWAH